MIPDPDQTTNQTENEVEQIGKKSDEVKQPTFKTEITLEINGSDCSTDDEDIVILRSRKKTIINKSAYSKLHKLKNQNSRNPFSPKSSRKYETTNTTKIIKNETETNNSKNAISDEETDEFIPCIIRSESVDTVDKIEKELSNFIMDNKKKDKKRTNSFRKLFSVPFFNKDKKKKVVKETNVNRTCPGAVDNYQNESNSNSFQRNTPQRHTVGCDRFKNRTNHTFPSNEPKRSIEEEPPPEVIRKYADIHINKFNRIRRSFECPEDNNSRLNVDNNCQNVPSNNITRYIDTSSSSTLESERVNTYQNALIAQAELQQARQLERQNNMFTSLPDDKTRLLRSNSLRRDTPPRAQEIHQPVNIVKPRARLPINSERSLPNPYQNGTDDVDNNLKTQKTQEETPQLNELYGTVFDAVQQKTKNSNDIERTTSPIPKSPRSPSLEGSKLKLPPNREILQPRMKSPLPSSKVSTEKIIATELLRNSNSLEKDSRRNSMVFPKDSQEIHSSTPNADKTSSVSEALNALRTKLEENDQNLKQELDQIRYTLKNLTHNESQLGQDVKTNNTNSPRSTLAPSSRSSIAISPQTVISEQSYGSLSRQNPILSPVQQNTLSRFSDNSSSNNIQNSSPSFELRQQNSCSTTNENRASAEVELRKKNTSSKGVVSTNPPVSPSKDEIRKSVEAYYWKEIKRIKDKEDYEIYLSQLQFAHNGFPSDYQFQSRRSRDSADSRGRRSSSVPRNSTRQQLSFENTMVIPEGASVMYNPHGQNIYGYLPPRSRAEFSRNSVSSMSNFKRNDSVDYGTYKPIFRRGSLSGNAPQPLPMNKKVSFSNSQQTQNPWPTKNGFTKSPPQRRLDKITDNQLDDDVFLPSQAAVQYQSYVQRMIPDKNSDIEALYSSNRAADIYTYNNMVKRAANYNSDSEAAYGRVRQYRTMSQQEMENLRNLQSKEVKLVNQNVVMPRPMPKLTRHESIQLPEPSYGYAVQYSRQPTAVDGFVPFRSQNAPYQQAAPRRNILITDEIYGQHIGYQNSSSGSVYGYSSNVEPLYGSKSKQITVRNKVCDIYGKIHDLDNVSREIQATGVLMGQMQNSPTSPVNFRRGTRLTASNNDMSRRRIDSFDYNRNVEMERCAKSPSIRPLPPLPPTGRVTQNENSKISMANSKKNSTNNNSSKKKKK